MRDNDNKANLVRRGDEKTGGCGTLLQKSGGQSHDLHISKNEQLSIIFFSIDLRIVIQVDPTPRTGLSLISSAPAPLLYHLIILIRLPNAPMMYLSMQPQYICASLPQYICQCNRRHLLYLWHFVILCHLEVQQWVAESLRDKHRVYRSPQLI